MIVIGILILVSLLFTNLWLLAVFGILNKINEKLEKNSRQHLYG
jgi:hypothetical protein